MLSSNIVEGACPRCGLSPCFAKNEEFIEWLAYLRGLDDHALVLVATSRIDEQITRLLKKLLLPDPDAKESNPNSDNLFGFSRPLGTFSSKINLAIRLQLVSKELGKLVDDLRDFRNKFAHSPKILTLDNQTFSARIANHLVYAEGCPIYPKMMRVRTMGGIDDSNKSKFLRITIIASLSLELAIAHAVLPIPEFVVDGAMLDS